VSDCKSELYVLAMVNASCRITSLVKSLNSVTTLNTVRTSE
jgi:hypothetical protein